MFSVFDFSRLIQQAANLEMYVVTTKNLFTITNIQVASIGIHSCNDFQMNQATMEFM